MNYQKCCPVCGSDSVPVLRKVLAPNENRALEPAVIAFRCGKGHVFLRDYESGKAMQRVDGKL